MTHLNRSAWNVLAAVGIVLLAVLAGCWVTRSRETPPPAPFVTRTGTPTAIPITVRPVTLTPTQVSPTPTPTLGRVMTTFTPNPSTLITPSPQTLPATGATEPASVVVPLLAGGLVLLIGLLARWASNKPKG